MDLKSTILIITSILFLIGCGNTDSKNSNTTFILSSEIQHLQIIQDNGYVPFEEDRYIEYNYSQSELSSDMLQKLDETSTTTEDLYCSIDGVTYEINITDNNDDISTFVSNNRDCGRENENIFISVDALEDIILLFK